MPEFRRRMAVLIDEEFTSSLMVIKEPRICRLLPILTGALKDLGIEPRFVLPYRDPLEVALSMASRGSYAMEHGFLLWLHYLLDAERGSRGFKRAFSALRPVPRRLAHQIDRLESQLGFVLPRRTGEGRSEIDRFLGLASSTTPAPWTRRAPTASCPGSWRSSGPTPS